MDANVDEQIPQSATTEQKMISGSVFSTLNEAWDKFKKDNGLWGKYSHTHQYSRITNILNKSKKEKPIMCESEREATGFLVYSG